MLSLKELARWFRYLRFLWEPKLYHRMFYKIEMLVDHTLEIKSGITPHGNWNCRRRELRSGSILCSPVGIQVLLLTGDLRKWRWIMLDVKAAFIETGSASRDFYVVSPRQFRFWKSAQATPHSCLQARQYKCDILGEDGLSFSQSRLCVIFTHSTVVCSAP